MWVDGPIPSLVISMMHPLQGDFWGDHVRDFYGSIQLVAIGPKMLQTVRKHRREREKQEFSQCHSSTKEVRS